VKNDDIFVENVDGGYRIWCGVCGEEETIPIPETGMPFPALTAWMDSFRNLHVDCRKTPD